MVRLVGESACAKHITKVRRQSAFSCSVPGSGMLVVMKLCVEAFLRKLTVSKGMAVLESALGSLPS